MVFIGRGNKGNLRMNEGNPRVVGIVQARMTSTRLPGKILMKVLGKPLLEHELARLSEVPELSELVVATTVNTEDDPVVDLCNALGVKSFRGSESDVLDRFYKAAELHEADIVARFTADCPIIDHTLASRVIKNFLENRGSLDYVGIDYERIPRGMDTEVFGMEALLEAHSNGRSKLDREHVTWFIHTNPEKFRISRYSIDENWGHYRLTVDTQEDFKLIEAVFGALYPSNPRFTLEDAIHLLDATPELAAINAGIEQKRYA
jgi:spore coat polysaccharide biosynthesis protein SpsF